MENVRTEQDIFDVLGTLDKMKEESSRRYSTVPLLAYLKDALATHKTMPLIAQVLEHQLTMEENLLLLFMMWDKMNNQGDDSVISLLASAFSDKIPRARFTQQVLNGSAPIVSKGLVKTEFSRYDLGLKLTDISLGMLKKAGIVLYEVR